MKRFLLVAALFAAQTVLAQGWPSKPVRWIVPYSPGGATDIATRPVAERVGQALGGLSGVVENRAGAGGNIGVEAAAKSAPDGYTLLVAVDAVASNPHLYKLSWDPFRDLVPVIQLARQPVVLAVQPFAGRLQRGGIRRGGEAEARPGFRHLRRGLAAAHHRRVVRQARRHPAHARAVQGRRPGDRRPGRGQIQVGSLGSSPLIPFYKSGKLRLLAQSTSTRAPTLSTSRPIRRPATRAWKSSSGSACSRPPARRRRSSRALTPEIGKALADPGIRERYAQAALEPVGGGADVLARLLRSDYEKIRPTGEGIEHPCRINGECA